MRVSVLFILAAACGGGGGGGGEGSGSAPAAGEEKLTSIDPNKKMGDLTKEQTKQLCEDFKAYQKKIKPSDAEMLRMNCAAKSMFQSMQSTAKDDAALRAECKKAADECVAKKEVPPERELDCTSEDALGKMSECKGATIAEISDCVRDMSGVMKRFASEDLCAGLKVGDKDAVERMMDKVRSAKCEALESKCTGGAGSGEGAPAATTDPALEKEAITKVGEFKTKMCACKDKACAEGVAMDMQKWGEDMARKTQGAAPSMEGAKKMTDILTGYTECMTKLLAPEGSGSAGSAAPSKGSAAAGSGSAKK